LRSVRGAVRRSLSVRALREYCEVLAFRETVARHAHTAITQIEEKQLIEIRKEKNDIESPPCGTKKMSEGETEFDGQRNVLVEQEEHAND